MPRANSSVPRHRRHRKIVKQAKGYYGVRKSNFRAAKDAVERSLQFSYRDRRQKKRTIRSLWIVRINAAVREHGLNYSTFVNLLKNKNIMMNRKTLAYLAVNDKDAFDAIVKSVSWYRIYVSLSEKIQEIKSTFDSDYKSVKNNQLDNQLVYNKYLGRKGLMNTLYPLLAKVCLLYTSPSPRD